MQSNSWRKAIQMLQGQFSFLPWRILVPAAQAQAVYGSIFGTVTDNTGAVIPECHDYGDRRGQRYICDDADQRGRRNIGCSTLFRTPTASMSDAPGFTRSSSDNVVVYADTAPKVDLKMSVGSTSNTVTVTGAAPILQTDRADVSTILNARAVSDLPNLERNFTEFELLTPGTTYIGWSVGQATNPQQSEQIEVNGQLPFATGYRTGWHRQPGPDPGCCRHQPKPRCGFGDEGHLPKL